MDTISSIRVSPSGRYFVDKHGAPVFWLGDTQWELFRLFEADTAMRILTDRQIKGFNVILIMLTGVDIGKADPSIQQVPYLNLHGESPWVGDDPLKPNEKYFQHIDPMIRLGEKTGQTFVVGMYHKWHKDIITLEKARQWATWVARRYRDVPNLIWSMHPQALDEFIPVCKELAAGLQVGDGGAHLISVHPDPMVASSSFIHNESWLAFNMIQTCINYDQIHAAVTADYLRTPAKPVVMAEGGYEGEEFGKLHTPHIIRKQAYWTQLSGGHYVYGHNDCWKLPLAWQERMAAPGSVQMQIFKEMITSCPGWWEMIPDQSLIQRGVGNGQSLHVAARSPTENWALAYFSTPSTMSIRLDALKADQQVRATWIDPSNGNHKAGGLVPGGKIHDFTSPDGWEDAVLLVEAQG